LQQTDLPVYLIKLREDPESADSSTGPRLQCTASCKDSLEHILYPTDFSDTARIAFDVLRQLAGRPSKRITLFHVQASGQVDLTNAAQLEQFNRIDRERLETLSSEIREKVPVDVDIALGQGPAARLIVEKARLTGATMILMGSQGRGYISDLFLGGVTYHVLRNTPLPVLVIPARRFAISHGYQSTDNESSKQ
jgi:nucleotide-binding universal stress UspA family protein